MAMKYCEEHKIYYDYNDSCPECGKFGKIAGKIIGSIIGGGIVAVATAGKKINDKIKEDNVRSKERQTAINNRQSDIVESSCKIAENDIKHLTPYDLCIKANDLFNSKRYAEAIIYYEQGIKLYPNENTFWGNKGMALEAIGRYAEAISCYDQAIKLNPNSNWQSFKTNALKLQRKNNIL
ncbi:hypothetical protein AGMMS50239_21800 [Bacteroidia bacterium]|nr:hypothetical protein AGMMS50239_21800 [Bacteroidia bacterium]